MNHKEALEIIASLEVRQPTVKIAVDGARRKWKILHRFPSLAVCANYECALCCTITHCVDCPLSGCNGAPLQPFTNIKNEKGVGEG